jgi:hypothetical protein
MGYLDKTTPTVTAHFTKRGRELLADALAGNTTGDYIITKFALGDDEIDYSLYDESQPTNLRGRVIENMPLVESFIKGSELMNYFMTDAPEIAVAFGLSNIPNSIDFTGEGDMMVLSPITENLDGTEAYEFVLEHDNLCNMYDANSAPIADFMFVISDQGSPPAGSSPIANFNWINSGLIP